MALTIQEVAEILSVYRLVPRPQHIITISEPEEADHYRGWAGRLNTNDEGVIFLMGLANDEVVLHEALHLQGLGQPSATFLAKAMVVKYRVLCAFPILKSILSFPTVKYEHCSGCKEFEWLHQKFCGQGEHFKLV